jgi:hypothetical protein
MIEMANFSNGSIRINWGFQNHFIYITTSNINVWACRPQLYSGIGCRFLIIVWIVIFKINLVFKLHDFPRRQWIGYLWPDTTLFCAAVWWQLPPRFVCQFQLLPFIYIFSLCYTSSKTTKYITQFYLYILSRFFSKLLRILQDR